MLPSKPNIIRIILSIILIGIVFAVYSYYHSSHTPGLAPGSAPGPTPGPAPGSAPGPTPGPAPGSAPFVLTKDWSCLQGVVKNVGSNKGTFYTKIGAESMCSSLTRYECHIDKCEKSDNPFALYTDSTCENACSIQSSPNPTLTNPNDYPATANYSQTPCQDSKSFDPSKPAYNIDPRMMLGSSVLIQAAKDDNNDWANYGIATHSNSKSNCGRCYQIEYTPQCGIVNTGELHGEGCTSPYNCYPSQKDFCNFTTGKCTKSPQTPLIVQNFNTGIDCSMSIFPCNFSPGSNCEETVQQCGDNDKDPSCSDKRYKQNYVTNTYEPCTGTSKDDCTRRKIVGQTTKYKDEGGQFDVYMGFGGFGAFDGCTNKSSQQLGFYGGNAEDWPGGKSPSAFESSSAPGNPDTRYGGALNKDQCSAIAHVPGFRGEDKDWINNTDKLNFGKELIDSCNLAFSDENPYHGNWAVEYKEVECPDNLIKTTGLALKNRSIGVDGKKLSPPSKTLSNNDSVKGFTSSMMDCCKPSCAWQDIYEKVSCAPNNNEIDANWRSLYTVDHDGNRMTRADDDGILKPYIKEQPDQKYNCTSSSKPSVPQKVCFYNDICRTALNEYLSPDGKCNTPQAYCDSCKQRGVGNPVNSKLADENTKWIPDIFQDEEHFKSWLGQPNNGGNLACASYQTDPNQF